MYSILARTVKTIKMAAPTSGVFSKLAKVLPRSLGIRFISKVNSQSSSL